jgi:PAS domain S-box-containing protein
VIADDPAATKLAKLLERLPPADRNTVQEAIESVKESYRAVLGSVPNAVYRCRPDTERTMRFLSDAIEGITGYAAQAFLDGSRSYLNLVDERDRELVESSVGFALTRREPFSIEYRIRDANGNLRWVQEQGRGVASADGTVRWIDGVIADVTDRKDAERQLARTSGLVMTLIETLRSGVLVEDEQRQILFVNQVLCDDFRLGTEREALVGAEATLALELMKDNLADPPRFQERIEQIASAGEDVRGEEVPLADGRVLELDHASLWLGAGHAGHVWHVRDITERKRIEQELARQNEELRTLDRMKDDFVALVTHELRTPVTSIMGYVDLLLEEEAMPEAQLHCLGVVHRNAKRLLRLVGDLLFVAQLEAGKTLQLDGDDVDLAQVVADSLEAQRVRAERNGVRLVPDIVVVPPLPGDAGRLGQLLDNLVSNAIKYSPDGGEVRIGLRHQGDLVILEVADRGIGIPEAEQARLFERFFRASTATGRSIPGTGLGLTITRTIAEAHGGRITFESHEGVGTAFRVEFPLPLAKAA